MLSQKHTCRKKGIGRREEEVESRGKKTKGKRKAVKPQAKAKKRLKSNDGSALPTHNAEEDAPENGAKEESIVTEVAEELESIGVREVVIEEEQPQLKSNDIGQMADSSASAEQAGVPPLAVSIDNSEVPQPPLDSGACAEQASVPTLAEPPVSIDNSEVPQPPLDSGACAEQAGVPPLAEPAVSIDNSEVPQPPLDSGACAEPAGAPPASSSAASSSAPAAPPAPSLHDLGAPKLHHSDCLCGLTLTAHRATRLQAK